MKLIVSIDVDYEEIAEDNVLQGLEEILDMGAETTCSIVTLKEAHKAEDVVIISKSEYESLTEDAEFLSCLAACGVDNWDGYSDARQMISEEEEEY